MPTFIYKAKKGASETVKGQIAANSEEEAVDLINQLGLLPVSVEEKSGTEVSLVLTKAKKVGLRDVCVFSKQLGNLLKSGVSLLRALFIIQEQTENKYFQNVIGFISEQIKQGKSFSDVLAMFPQIFSQFYITMVRVGEESGQLENVLLNVAEHQKKHAEFVRKVSLSLIYPLLMGVVGVGTVYFILTFVLPKMSALFDGMAGGLPLPTKILLSISAFLSANTIWILLALSGVYVVLRKYLSSVKGKKVLSMFLLKIPLLGHVVQKSELSQFCRALFVLLKNGVPVIKALHIAIPLVSNDIIRHKLILCQEGLISGGSFGESLRSFKEIPSMMGHLISIGEESGSLNDVLLEIAESYETDVNDSLKVVTTLFEPVIILFIGGIIGFMVFAMLMPIFQMDILGY